MAEVLHTLGGQVSFMRLGICARSLTVTMLLFVIVIPGCTGGGEVATDRAGVEPDPQSRAEIASGGDGFSDTQIVQDDFDRKFVNTAELGIRAEDVRRGSEGA
jgi:hypothetical protein